MMSCSKAKDLDVLEREVFAYQAALPICLSTLVYKVKAKVFFCLTTNPWFITQGVFKRLFFVLGKV